MSGAKQDELVIRLTETRAMADEEVEAVAASFSVGGGEGLKRKHRNEWKAKPRKQ